MAKSRLENPSKYSFLISITSPSVKITSLFLALGSRRRRGFLILNFLLGWFDRRASIRGSGGSCKFLRASQVTKAFLYPMYPMYPMFSYKYPRGVSYGITGNTRACVKRLEKDLENMGYMGYKGYSKKLQVRARGGSAEWAAT